jgi:hypothetical protein
MNNTSLNSLYLLIEQVPELVRAMLSWNYAVSAHPGFDSGLHCYNRVMIETKELEKLAPTLEICSQPVESVMHVTRYSFKLELQEFRVNILGA